MEEKENLGELERSLIAEGNAIRQMEDKLYRIARFSQGVLDAANKLEPSERGAYSKYYMGDFGFEITRSGGMGISLSYKGKEFLTFSCKRDGDSFCPIVKYYDRENKEGAAALETLMTRPPMDILSDIKYKEGLEEKRKDLENRRKNLGAYMAPKSTC